MIAALGLVAVIGGTLAVGWLIGARDAKAHQYLEDGIATDTRAAFIDDAAEISIDNEPAGGAL
ncbi:hypothetical protein A5742_07825 [Mycolicibacterium fortuitum]|uniref:Uncharacterized protein n=1 Tax=Mycolicibacterium fortuitum TaxID=1766 RepID=A0ABD6QGS9_MYCFO|nr:hypothetical protein [Mycolicibacterium fortuitum]OMC38009.1 hypothetical protein A5742_07825 [Mycolicibacterium fortuitum]